MVRDLALLLENDMVKWVLYERRLGLISEIPPEAGVFAIARKFR